MFAEKFLHETAQIAAGLDAVAIERMVAQLSQVDGRVYCIGLGGSLANAMHMAADLRKLCLIDAVAPDNLAELTAWANDAEWRHLFDGFLAGIGPRDALFVLSVGGGRNGVSLPLIEAIGIAKLLGARVFGIVGPDGGYTAEHGHCVIRIPVPDDSRVTPHVEAFQAVVWHALVSHPLLQKRQTKW